MRRRLFDFAALLSLLLCLATVLLWVRSYWIVDELTIASLTAQADGSYGALTIGVGLGNCGFELVEWVGPGLVEHVANYVPPDRTPLDVRNWVGLSSSGGLMVPLWIPVVVFAGMPIRTAIRTLKRKQAQKRGDCTCGYNLTGNTSGICPECGTACTTSGSRVDEIPAVPQGEK